MADRSKLARARRAFLGESEPDMPLPTSADGFAPWVNPTRQLANEEWLANLRLKQSDRSTQMEGNAYQQDRYRSDRRIIPFSEAADIVGHQSRQKQAEREIEADPFIREDTRRQSDINKQRDQAAMEDFPQTRKLGQLQTQDAIESIESGEKDIQRDKIDPLAYDFNLRTIQAANPKLDVKEAQRQARNAVLRMRNDAPYIEAIEEEALQTADPRFRVKFLEDVRDPETGARFTKIRDDAPQDQVAALLRKNTYNRARVAREQEERRATQGKSREQVLVLDKLADGVRAEIKSLEMGAGDKADLPALKAKLKKYEDRLEKMLDESVAPMSLDDQDLAKPGN